MKKSVKYTFALGLTMLAFQACTTVDYDGEYAKKGNMTHKIKSIFMLKMMPTRLPISRLVRCQQPLHARPFMCVSI